MKNWKEPWRWGIPCGVVYQVRRLEKRIFELSEKRGVDHVIEVGGAGTLGRSLACVAAGGHVALIGVLTGFDSPNLPLFPLLAKNATVSGIYVGHRQSFEQFVRFLETRR